jgi:hypothetical protein
LLDALEMAYESGAIDDGYDHWDRNNELDGAGESLADLRANELLWRTKIGDDRYEDLEHFARQRVQEPFWGRGALTARHMVMMFNLPGRSYDFDSFELWDRVYASSPLHIRLSELPQSDGQSATWKNEIDTKLLNFSKQYGRLLNPLLVPVAVEVVIRPSPPSRQNNVHDLDNVLRKYLLPQLLRALEPPSAYAFTMRDLPKGAPPPSTRIGFTRYEAWRLPPAPEGGNGFVSLAIVSDASGYNGGLDKIEDAIDKWVKSLD